MSKKILSALAILKNCLFSTHLFGTIFKVERLYIMKRPAFTLTVVFCLILASLLLVSAAGAAEVDDFKLARQAFKDSFYEEAQGYFQEFINNYPQSTLIDEASLFVALCSYNIGDLHQAQGELENLINDPEAATIKDEALYWLAQIYIKNKDYNNSLKPLQEVVQEYPESDYNVLSYFLLAESKIRKVSNCL